MRSATECLSISTGKINKKQTFSTEMAQNVCIHSA